MKVYSPNLSQLKGVSRAVKNKHMSASSDASHHVSHPPNWHLWESQGKRAIAGLHVVGECKLAVELLVDELDVERLRVTSCCLPCDRDGTGVRPVSRSRHSQGRDERSSEGESTGRQEKKGTSDMSITDPDFFHRSTRTEDAVGKKSRRDSRKLGGEHLCRPFSSQKTDEEDRRAGKGEEERREGGRRRERGRAWGSERNVRALSSA